MRTLSATIQGLVMLASLALSGCSTLGEPFDLDNARRVQNGMSRDDVIRVMGSEPSPVEGADEGKLTWYFAYANPISFGSVTERVSFRLDEHGRVYGIPKGGIHPELDY